MDHRHGTPWYAHRSWPLCWRLSTRLTRRCRCCILSAQATSLDARGLCALCVGADHACTDHAAPRGDASSLEVTLTHGIGRGVRYDALLLVSGGADSTYLLYALRHTFPALRLLCVMIDTGFLADQALKNVAKVTIDLGVDVLIFRSALSAFGLALRDAFLTLNGRATNVSIDGVEGRMIFALGRQLAHDWGIPLLLSGMTSVQLQHVAPEALQMPETDPAVLFPLCAWGLEGQVLRHQLFTTTPFTARAMHPLRTNSRLLLPMGVLDVLTLGYSSFEPEIAQRVREGQADRRFWLDIAQRLEYGVRTGRLTHEAQRLLQELDLTLEDVLP